MRVGVYVDAFNVYYGVKGRLGNGPGWKWIDLRTLASRYAKWPGSTIDRVVYCTARVNDPSDPSQTQRQDFYLKALRRHGAVDLIEEGYYSSWAKESVMTVEPSGTRMPTALRDPQALFGWSHDLQVRRDAHGVLLATVRKREEKGSDVNVATHLLVDILERRVDAAIVMSNDSDLALPLSIARMHVPVGLLNPSKRHLAGALSGKATEGAGQHWWIRLDPNDVKQCQLPDPVGGISRPVGW